MKSLLLAFSIFLSINIFAQQENKNKDEGHSIKETKSITLFKTNYKQLLEYEGKYEYFNGATLKIAASPIDTILLALINESRYPLKPAGKDLFLNSGNGKVQFYRDKNNKIAGYSTDYHDFKLLSKTPQYPKEMWYARPNLPKNYTYTYQQPKDYKDGIKPANLYKLGIDKAPIQEMMQKLTTGDYRNVHSILIMKDGKLVLEEYFYEHHKDRLHEMRSATKSFISAMAGVAIDKGYISSLDEKMLIYFPEYTFKNDLEAKQKITLKHLLTNQTGLDCDASNPNAAGNENDMAYKPDWIQYSLDLPMVDSAGGRGMYCSSNPIIMGRVIEKATKMDLAKFAEQTLFKDLGIKKYDWHFKADSTSSETFCQVSLTSRDMAKFGQMYLNKGLWNGKQVLSKDWVNQSLTNHSVIQGLDYGYLWWTKYYEVDGKKYYAKLAQGNGGQKILIFEDLNLVIVSTAGHYNVQSPINEIVGKYILPAFVK